MMLLVPPAGSVPAEEAAVVGPVRSFRAVVTSPVKRVLIPHQSGGAPTLST